MPLQRALYLGSLAAVGACTLTHRSDGSVAMRVSPSKRTKSDGSLAAIVGLSEMLFRAERRSVEAAKKTGTEVPTFRAEQ